MVADEFFKLSDALKLSSYVGLEDFTDKLNFMFTVVLISLSMFVVTLKTYFLNPLACYVATTPSGSNFDGYIENYCWVHGTIPILPGVKLPQKEEDWKLLDSTDRITYYQWVPFVLGLQCILFYIPKIFWDIICYNKIGTNLEALVNDANKASSLPPSERKTQVEKLCKTLENLLYKHRDYRQGNMADIRRKIYDTCNFCVISKHLGTWLVTTYFFVKILYGVNVIGQLYLMKSFLGFNSSITAFGYTVLTDLVNGRDWHDTGIFPRVSYCYNADIKQLGTSNAYIGQCALPINMLNEKIYVFLWFWIFIVGLATIISFFIWFVRIAFAQKRSEFIKRFLVMHQKYDTNERLIVNQFTSEFLRHDGVFLIRMIYINGGDMVTADIVNTLWVIYRTKYADIDFRNFNNYKKLKNASGTSNESSDNSLRNEKENFV